MASFVCTLFILRHLDKLYYMTNSRWCQQSFIFSFSIFFACRQPWTRHSSQCTIFATPPSPSSPSASSTRTSSPSSLSRSTTRCTTSCTFDQLDKLACFTSFLCTLSTRSCISLVSWVSSSTTRSLQSLLFKASSPVCFSFSCPWVSSALTTLSTCALHRDQPSE